MSVVSTVAGLNSNSAVAAEDSTKSILSSSSTNNPSWKVRVDATKSKVDLIPNHRNCDHRYIRIAVIFLVSLKRLKRKLIFLFQTFYFERMPVAD